MRITEYPPGTPCWVDIASSDLERSKTFYAQLFGWDPQTSPDPAAGGYTLFLKDGEVVAGGTPLFAEGQPPAWNWYAASADADETARRVEAAGGRVLMAPMDVLGQGRLAVFTDPTGTPFSIWQKLGFAGAGLANEPGTFAWNELMTRDPDTAAEFYRAALGWTAKNTDDPGPPYTEFQVGGHSVAGMMPMLGDQWPAELPDHWMIYFAVADADAAAEKVGQLGGAISVPPTDTPVGRFTIATDDVGAHFGVIALLS